MTKQNLLVKSINKFSRPILQTSQQQTLVKAVAAGFLSVAELPSKA